MVKNPFFSKSFVFSHINISYASSLMLAIFFFDIKAELKRIRKKQYEKAFYYLSGSFTREMWRYYTFFRKNLYKAKVTRAERKWRLNWKRYRQFYRSGLKLIKPVALFKHTILKIRRQFPKFFRSRRLRRRLKLAFITLMLKYRIKIHKTPYKYFPAWIINPYRSNIKAFKLKGKKPNKAEKRKKNKLFKSLHILYFLLRYLKVYHNKNYKMRIFYLNILFKAVTSSLVVLSVNKALKKNQKILFHKLIYFKNVIFLGITRYKYFYIKYFSRLLRSRFTLLNILTKIVLFSLKKTAFSFTNNPIIIKYFALNNRNLSARFLATYIGIKLTQYFSLNSVIKPIIRRFKRLNAIQGFRFIISGRLTRKERAAYIVHNFKRMPLGNPNKNIDYAYDFRALKFGTVGIKVYLFLSKRHTPYYYFFEFKNSL